MSPGKKRAFVLGAAAALATTAFAAPVGAQDEPSSGGIIVYGDWQPVSQLNPYMTNTVTNFQATTLVWPPPIDIDTDGNYVPDLLEEVPSAENGGLVVDEDGDGFTLNLKMKPDLKWSDGMPLTLNDHKWTYDWAVEMLKSGVGCGRCAAFVPLVDPTAGVEEDADGNAVTDVDVLYAPENQVVESYTISEDGLTAEVRFRQNYAAWRDWLASYYIIPGQFWGDIAPEDVATTAVPGSPALPEIPASGPFMISGSSSDGIDYVPNPEYNASDGPYLDGLRYQFYGSKDGMIAAFLAGEIDLALDMTQADFPAVSQVDPSIGRAEVDPQWGYEHLDLNFMSTSVGFDDPLVRTAIAHAIDKQKLSEVLFPGAGVEPACSPAPPSIWYHTETTCPEYDPDQSMALLEEAGWMNEGGAWVKDVDGDGESETLRLKMCTSSGNPTRLTTLGVVAQDLAAVGINTDIQTEDAASVYFADWADTTPETECSIYRGSYDVALFAWVFTGDLYGDAFYVYHSSQIPSDDNPNGYNNTRIADPDIDAALDAIGASVDPAFQLEQANVVQQGIIDTVTEIPLYYRSETTGISNRVGGWEKYNPSTAGALWDTESWFVQE